MVKQQYRVMQWLTWKIFLLNFIWSEVSAMSVVMCSGTRDVCPPANASRHASYSCKYQKVLERLKWTFDDIDDWRRHMICSDMNITDEFDTIGIQVTADVLRLHPSKHCQAPVKINVNIKVIPRGSRHIYKITATGFGVDNIYSRKELQFVTPDVRVGHLAVFPQLRKHMALRFLLEGSRDRYLVMCPLPRRKECRPNPAEDPCETSLDGFHQQGTTSSTGSEVGGKSADKGTDKDGDKGGGKDGDKDGGKDGDKGTDKCADKDGDKGAYKNGDKDGKQDADKDGDKGAYEDGNKDGDKDGEKGTSPTMTALIVVVAAMSVVVIVLVVVLLVRKHRYQKQLEQAASIYQNQALPQSSNYAPPATYRKTSDVDINVYEIPVNELVKGQAKPEPVQETQNDFPTEDVSVHDYASMVDEVYENEAQTM